MDSSALVVPTWTVSIRVCSERGLGCRSTCEAYAKCITHGRVEEMSDGEAAKHSMVTIVEARVNQVLFKTGKMMIHQSRLHTAAS